MTIRLSRPSTKYCHARPPTEAIAVPRRPGTSGTHVPAPKTPTDATATPPASASVDSAPHRIGSSTVRKATASARTAVRIVTAHVGAFTSAVCVRS